MEILRVKTGKSLFYFVYIAACFALFFGLYFGLRHKSRRAQNMALLIFLWLNFALHFLKLLFSIYDVQHDVTIIRKATFENICAVSTLIFPFIYMSKNAKVGKDYMFYLGAISGFAGCVFPAPVDSWMWKGEAGLPFYHLETIRYYICHAGIWIVPVLMVLFGIHKLDYRRIWKALFFYFGVLGLIIINEIILVRIGWVHDPGSLKAFLDNEGGRDLGYAFGPNEMLEKPLKYVLWLTPKAFKDPYVPILWEVFPVLILGGAGCFAVSMIWEHKHFKDDCIALKNKFVGWVARVSAWYSKKRGAAEGNEEESGESDGEDEPSQPAEPSPSDENVQSDAE